MRCSWSWVPLSSRSRPIARCAGVKVMNTGHTQITTSDAFIAGNTTGGTSP